jgi:hypothetical protein
MLHHVLQYLVKAQTPLVDGDSVVVDHHRCRTAAKESSRLKTRQAQRGLKKGNHRMRKERRWDVL